MRRKRLQHAADTLCRMFCGWRLANSYRDLARLGSGTLSIDALAGSCLFDGVPIEAPTIAGELQHWLRENLTTKGIPPGGLVRADLTAHLSIVSLASKPRAAPVHFLGPDGKPVRAGEFFRCEIDCEGEVATDEAVYRSRYNDVEVWPAGWPDA